MCSSNGSSLSTTTPQDRHFSSIRRFRSGRSRGAQRFEPALPDLPITSALNGSAPMAPQALETGGSRPGARQGAADGLSSGGRSPMAQRFELVRTDLPVPPKAFLWFGKPVSDCVWAYSDARVAQLCSSNGSTKYHNPTGPALPFDSAIPQWKVEGRSTVRTRASRPSYVPAAHRHAMNLRALQGARRLALGAQARAHHQPLLRARVA